ncbi:branched-chain amino acid transport system substrate-binding protein [Meinhardsimonia xiamenensis]|uniref:Branched-chain amino acid transport system substrate-binding protein n=2 Tax=Meinhardsimonia xiamenensis TaxID=990712 RepID=A0A1G9FL38_9RHOB|nr:amino acid ABC transporter substrate-binding protein [Meinhardsimonia xiamenensis]PRX37788.1 amino acid/amide ABC transporter substrate-binding protein (HAAT family) [Meinhardsimonia xiamenensis]SDK89148.1 branched-chain amino acid transport system substrate-binding protein [Meinhardsimonia xiamenensis]
MTLRIGLMSFTAAAALALAGAAAAEECGTITLGAAISLTGKYATNGYHTQNGYEFAIRKIAEAGGVKVGDKCYNFKVIYYDDESKGDRGATLAERLINQDGVQYMLGPYSSGLTAAIAPVTEKYKIPMVEAEGASRSLFNKGYRYLFAVLSTSEQYLASAVDLAALMAEKSGKSPSDVKVAVAVENDPFSLDVRAGVIEDAEGYGMQIVVDEKLPRDLSDMTAILTKVKLVRPDLLVVSGHSKGAATAVRQIAEQGVSVPMIAMTHCEAADIVGNFGEAAEGILCSTQWAETLKYEDPIFGSAANYNEEFKAAFPEYADRAVPYQAAQASAAVLVYKDAFERAGTVDDREAVRDAIAATDMMTFYGPIKFDETGKNIAKPMVLRQIQNGQYNVVAPPEFASHELIWPRP